MDAIKKILPYAVIALAVLCIGFILQWSMAVKDMHDYDMQDESSASDIDFEPVTLELNFNNTNSKYNKDAEIEAYDFLQSYRQELEINDIHFVSSIEGWGEDKFIDASWELTENIHGEEMRRVSAVIFEEGSGRYCYGSSQIVTMHYGVPASLYNFFPENYAYNLPMEMSFLRVSNIAPHLDIADIAQAMSVAYGYHYAWFNMNITGTKDDAETEYFKLRAEGNDKIKIEIESNDEYKNNFVWYLQQIAAYDYMFLMGSANANRILTEFPHMTSYPYDSFDEIYEGFDAAYANGRNTTPHINLSLTMPDRVVGLREYFYSFVDEDVPEYTLSDDMENINFESKLKKVDSRVRSIIKARVFEVSWDVPYDDDDVKYSLVKTNLKDEIVSTRYINMGSDINSSKVDQPAIRALGSYKYCFDFRQERGYRLYLIAAFPDGSITVSEPIELIYPDEEWNLD